MDIACPNCAATYRVPDSLLAHGKALRCAACGEEWVPEMPPAQSPALALAEPVAEQATPEPALTELQPAPSLPVPPIGAPPIAAPPIGAPLRPAPPTTPPPLTSRRRLGSRPASVAMSARLSPGRVLALAWLASLACVLLALVALVMFGDAIAAAWPPFARVTALIGG
jgi:predicted Zn finger-like uncharacterized protein